MFAHIAPYAGDPILSLNEDFQKDPRAGKINLSIGIYFDDAGRIPVMESVRRAEAILATQVGPKPYLPMEGAANFRAVVPTAYPVPTDGPVGRMLVAGGRHPWRPAHLHFMIQAPEHETLITHLFIDGDPYLDSDTVFGVRRSLVVSLERGRDGTRHMRHTFVLAPSPESS